MRRAVGQSGRGTEEKRAVAVFDSGSKERDTDERATEKAAAHARTLPYPGSFGPEALPNRDAGRDETHSMYFASLFSWFTSVIALMSSSPMLSNFLRSSSVSATVVGRAMFP